MMDYKLALQRFTELDAQLLVAKEQFLQVPTLQPKERDASFERFRDIRRDWMKATTDLRFALPNPDEVAIEGRAKATPKV